MQEEGWTSGGRDAVQFSIESSLDAQPKELSLLFVLTYIASSGSDVETLFGEIGKGAQEMKLKDGTQSISLALADKIGAHCIRLGSPVSAIAQDDKSATLTFASGQVLQTHFPTCVVRTWKLQGKRCRRTA